jgi:hypothetical protein
MIKPSLYRRLEALETSISTRRNELFRHLKACKYPGIQAKGTDETLKAGPSATKPVARTG